MSSTSFRKLPLLLLLVMTAAGCTGGSDSAAPPPDTVVVASGPTKDTNGVEIPIPSKIAGVVPKPHPGSANGAGQLYAWPADPKRCDNTTVPVASSWHHNIDFTNHRVYGQIDNFDMGVNESLTYEFTPSSVDVSSGFISVGPTTALPLPANFISISTKPCDFDLTKLVAGAGRDLCYSVAPVDNSLYYTVTTGTASGTCKLVPGTKYYFNLRWQNGTPGANNAVDSCAAIGYARCGVWVQFR